MSRLSSGRLARALTAAGAGLVAALAAWSVLALPVQLEPGTPAWRRLVHGVGPEGRLGTRATVLLPGITRRAPSTIVLALDAGGAAPTLGVAVDGGPLRPLRSAAGTGLVVPLPATGTSGARLDLVGGDGAPLALRGLSSASDPVAARVVLLAAVLAALVTLALTSWGQATALALGLWAGTLVALALAPPLLWLSMPSGPGLARFLPAILAAAVAVALVWPRVERRAAFGRAAALLAALVFGAWVRAVFLPSAGSWDTEYWKTWMLRTQSHGLARVYGDPEPWDAGRLLAQARGQVPLWKAPRGGRDYVVDYPPLAMAAWRASLAFVGLVAPGLERAEAENVAVKLPAIAGDLGGVLVILWTLRRRPARALGLAGLYWALPVSWLSSAVLGFLDAALAPLAAAALVAAGRGRAVSSGVSLALACLFKPTAGLVAPSAAVALPARTGRALATALGVVALFLLPFVFAGTLGTALVQMYRIVFQERLSGGFPNPWWVAGHALTLREAGMSALAEPVRFVRVDALAFPARPLGVLLFAALAALIVWRQRRHAGPGPALLGGAALVFAYGMVAVGVHENHPHPLYLLLFATGLPSRRLRVLTAVTSTVYVLNMLAMSGLGRFYGPRYAVLGPLIQAAAAFRMAPGFDVTLILTAVNLAAFAWLLAGLGDDMKALAEAQAEASPLR